MRLRPTSQRSEVRRKMLNEICMELKNWFDRGLDKFHGAIEIKDGKINDEDIKAAIKPNQYFRIVGSVFNDGVWKNDENLSLTDELFVGAVWLMAVPREIVDLSKEIDEWNKKYGDAINTPYQSESFAGYSYSKASGSNGSGPSWKSVFGSRLNKWRKI